MKYIEIRGYRISLRSPILWSAYSNSILRLILRKPIRIIKSPIRKAQEAYAAMSEHDQQNIKLHIAPHALRRWETKQLEAQYHATEPTRKAGT